MAVFANFCLYQLGWFACVLGAGMDRPGLGMTCAWRSSSFICG